VECLFKPFSDTALLEALNAAFHVSCAGHATRSHEPVAALLIKTRQARTSTRPRGNL
jgi:hypothetical protein